MSDLIDNLKMWSGATIDNAHAKVQWDAVERIKALESQNAAMRDVLAIIRDGEEFLGTGDCMTAAEFAAEALQGVGE